MPSQVRATEIRGQRYRGESYREQNFAVLPLCRSAVLPLCHSAVLSSSESDVFVFRQDFFCDERLPCFERLGRSLQTA